MDTELRAALPKRACGVPFHPRSLRTIRELIHSLSGASRQQIIRQCCEHLGWSDYQGQAKVTAARSVLLSFHERGWIELPAARAVKRTSPSSSLPSGYEPIQIQLPLHQLQGITVTSQKAHADKPKFVQKVLDRVFRKIRSASRLLRCSAKNTSQTSIIGL